MTIDEKMDIVSSPTIGYWSALNGIEIKRIDYGIEIYVTCVENAWSSPKRCHRVRVNYTKTGNGYINLHSNRYYLDECIRC